MKAKLQWNFYEREWDVYQKNVQIGSTKELPLPPNNTGLFFYIKEKLFGDNSKCGSDYPYKDLKMLKKVQKEIMKRYHPDKHFRKDNGNSDKEQINMMKENINEICMITNKVYEMLTKIS